MQQDICTAKNTSVTRAQYNDILTFCCRFYTITGILH